MKVGRVEDLKKRVARKRNESRREGWRKTAVDRKGAEKRLVDAEKC